MEKPDVNPVNALCRTPHKPGKNSNFNKRGMRNNNKTCFRCDSACSHKVKCPAESKVCNKWKQLGHCAKYCKIKLTQKSDSHKDNSRQNPYPEQTLNRVTHWPSVLKEYKISLLMRCILKMASICLLLKICLSVEFSKLETIL